MVRTKETKNVAEYWGRGGVSFLAGHFEFRKDVGKYIVGMIGG